MEVKHIKGGVAFDDRGSVSFVNDFNFPDVKRFYLVKNHNTGFIRAWHGHKKEAKYVFVSSGSILLAAVKIDNWQQPSKDAALQKFILTGNSPSVLYIPPGYANGFRTLTADAQVMFFSTSTLEESKDDDIRFRHDYWNPWDIEYR